LTGAVRGVEGALSLLNLGAAKQPDLVNLMIEAVAVRLFRHRQELTLYLRQPFLEDRDVAVLVYLYALRKSLHRDWRSGPI